MGSKKLRDLFPVSRKWALGCYFFNLLFFLPTISEAKTVKYQTYEEEKPETVIGHLAEDLQLSATQGGLTSFRMMKQFNTSFIKLRESDGELTIGERIDRERICRQSLKCLIAFDVVSFSKEQFKLIHVEVEVKDINDNSPEFPHLETSLDISESAAIGTRIPLEVAVDEDVGSNYIQSYQILVNSHFTIEVLSRADGVKYAELVLLKELDRETQSSHVLELVATDGGSPSRSGTTNINIKVKDFNDNSPVFDQSSFSVELNEDAPVGFLLLDLNAVDADEGLNGEVVYGFGNQVTSEICQLFKVDRKSGRLTLEHPVDFETKKTYELDVQAYDLGPNPTPAICKIIIHIQDVNDNAPEISITPMTSISAGIAYITEAAAKDSFVALISTSDRDSGVNGKVHCTLYGHDHFKLQQAYEDSYMIVTTTSLDREKISEYNLTVVAEDLGSAPFRTIKQYTIRVSDENDNAPLFSKTVYEVSVVENNSPGAYITTVIARDPDLGHNGKVMYRLVDAEIMGSPVSTFVSVDPATGSIYALRNLNYEVVKQLQFRIQASDGGSPQLHSTAVINVKIVDQNDNAPSIIHPVLINGSAEVLVPRDAPSGYLITKIKASDADQGVNSELTYRIGTEEQHVAFSINKVTGEIYLNREISHEYREVIKITITVSDNGRPSLSSTATLHFIITTTAPHSGHVVVAQSPEDNKLFHMDMSVIVIIVLAGSCTLLLLAIILIATTCNRRKNEKETTGFQCDVDVQMGNGRNNCDTLISSHSGSAFDSRPYCSKSSFSNSHTTESDMCSSCEDGRDTACMYEAENRLPVSNTECYSALPGFDEEVVRPIAIWKGNSFSTISARDPEFSGKDSGKGDSDFNDSDSDVSGDGQKKAVVPGNVHNGLWVCTSECKILGHSDRCWSPSAMRASANNSSHTSQSLSSLAKTASLPRETLQRENYYQAHLPKTVGLQSVYEKVLHIDYDYVLVSPPRPVRIQEINETAVSVYAPTMTTSHTNNV
ncbi:protocadherin-8-like [Acipenser ruthenus]|uniref:protocadherin-8-like n=1 Tax=Acipenser ruthenus TaxID=7906 RepID=UPI0027429E0B|nr:protocadherin-8-like [Acipenser ruthenus]